MKIYLHTLHGLERYQERLPPLSLSSRDAIIRLLYIATTQIANPADREWLIELTLKIAEATSQQEARQKEERKVEEERQRKEDEFWADFHRRMQDNLKEQRKEMSWPYGNDPSETEHDFYAFGCIPGSYLNLKPSKFIKFTQD